MLDVTFTLLIGECCSFITLSFGVYIIRIHTHPSMQLYNLFVIEKSLNLHASLNFIFLYIYLYYISNYISQLLTYHIIVLSLFYLNFRIKKIYFTYMFFVQKIHWVITLILARYKKSFLLRHYSIIYSLGIDNVMKNSRVSEGSTFFSLFHGLQI